MYLILVVDDHAENCTPLVKLFRHAKVHAHPVYSGREALASMAERLPDVVLLDVMMPEMDGFAVLRTIRADRRYDGVTVVMYTAIVDGHTQAHALEMGAQGYVVKGTPFADLWAEVRRHLPPVPTPAPTPTPT